jgi:DNA-binding response OmpR family regulator
MSNERIGDLLVAAGVLTREKLEETWAMYPPSSRRLLSRIYELGLAHERVLAELLAKRTGVPVVVLSESTLDLRALEQLPVDVIRKFDALPVAVDERSLTVVCPDPDAPDVISSLSVVSGKRVIALIGLHAVVAEVIDRAFLAQSEGATVFKGKSSTYEQPFIALAQPPSIGSADRATALADLLVEAGLEERLRTRARALASIKQPAAWPAMVAGVSPKIELAVVPAPPPGERVALVVDDDAAIRDLVSITLSHDNYRVVSAQSGDDAIAKLRTVRPDIVVLDAMMPGLHGFEILIALKQSPAHKMIPVVMMSAVYTDWLQARHIEETHGADAFLKKPFGLAQLRGVVAQLTNRDAPRWTPPESAEARLMDVELDLDRAIAKGDDDDAEKLAHECLAIDPFSPRGWLARGDLLLSRGDIAGAWSAFENAIVYGPDNTTALVTLALVAERLGFRRRAQSIWSRATARANDEQRAIIEGYAPPETFTTGGG